MEFSSHRAHRLRGITYRTLATLLFAVLLWPQSEQSGWLLKLDENLYTPVTSDGYHSLLTDRIATVIPRLPLPKTGNSVDRYIAAANAHGAVEQLLYGHAPYSIVLTVLPSSRASEVGLRNGDQILSATQLPGCAKVATTVPTILLSSGVCASELRIHRGQREITIPLAPGDFIGAYQNQIRSTDLPEIPDVLSKTNGPSMGLSLALHYLDAHSAGSLFSHDKVVATGKITAGSFDVWPIGSLQLKTATASAAGATLFLLPQGQLDEVADFENMDVREVSSLREAVNILCKRGSNDSLCKRAPQVAKPTQ